MKSNLYFVENADGRQFAVKLLERGDLFGRNKSQIWKRDEYGVEIYDATFAGDGFGEIGQLVARYYVSTILEHASELELDASIPEWRIDKSNVRLIQNWLWERSALSAQTQAWTLHYGLIY